MSELDPQFIGYEEDGVMRIAGVPDAATAEQAMKDWSGDWRVVTDTFVCFLENTDGRHEIWDECAPDTPNAQRAWRLVDLRRPQILVPNDYNEPELQPNPYFEARRLISLD